MTKPCVITATAVVVSLTLVILTAACAQKTSCSTDKAPFEYRTISNEERLITGPNGSMHSNITPN